MKGKKKEYYCLSVSKIKLNHVLIPEPCAKGVAESPHVGGIPCFTNAVNDAFSHLGVTQVEMPHTSFNVWKTIHELGLDKQA